MAKQHRSAIKACKEAYGNKEWRAFHTTLIVKLTEMGIETKAIKVARGNPATTDFPRHVYIAVKISREGNALTFRRLRISESLEILEDKTLTDEPRVGKFTQDTKDKNLDFYDNRRDTNRLGGLLPYQGSFGKFRS